MKHERSTNEARKRKKKEIKRGKARETYFYKRNSKKIARKDTSKYAETKRTPKRFRYT